MRTPSKRFWTPAAIERLRRIYPDHTGAETARRLGYSLTSVYNKAAELRLGKSARFLASDLSGRIQRGRKDPRMTATQFKPGLTPWNKGKPFQAGGNSHLTRFRKGQVSKRWDTEIYTVGCLRLNTDGELEIKTRMGLRAWVRMARYVWWSETGRWPRRDQVVRCRNGDAHDTRFENLELISRRENMRRNSYHTNYPPQVARLVQLQGAISRQINQLKGQQA